ncbi:Mitochondrial presequence protease [Candida viswanathii]|uniref:Presequence protease, mitochondrial n=1 Tax=Candida viswanathii TaxID=5486 RepID=A0A367XVQ8_9ASCO|nr:Mitochondrial presequence protease [Candida viswanathii]
MLSARLKQSQKLQGVIRRYASTDLLAPTLRKYPIGLQLHGYEIMQATPIPEFSLVAVSLKHLNSGSSHLHLDSSNDSNNVFLIAFKTNPPDNTGVPHILEHTTLCGSSKYPVRDPFFKMTNRSLSNFMNAMTGHDYTFYPFATTNAKDFENLMDVYLSSVLEPNLNYTDFLQEGWRLENQDVNDIKSKLEFKGVVYNEMKGQYSNSAYYFYIKYLEAIYPSLNNSGGDPKRMVNLAYEDLIQFHSKNYHPSNSKTFTYGNLPLEVHLRRLNDYFKYFGKRTPSVDVKQPIFATDDSAIFDIIVPGPVDTMSGKDLADQYSSSVTWALGNPLEPEMQYDVFKWKILNSLFFEGHNSPFYQELIESGYGDDFSANTGLDATSALLSFTVGLNFLNKPKVDNLENKIIEIVKTKILPELENNESSSYNDRIKAILHQIELGFKRHKPEFGFGLLSSIVPTWVNGVDPVESLQIEKILTQFKEDFAANGVSIFKELLEKSLCNPEAQRFKFTMEPVADFTKQLADDETARLDKRVSELSEEDKQVIYDRNLNLAKLQGEEEDTDVLPTLTIDNIAKRGDFYAIDLGESNKKVVYERVVDTNGLIYAYALKDIAHLPTKYYKYLPLFNSCLTNLAGTEATPITELETRIQMLTGSLSFSSKVSADPYNIEQLKLQYVLSGMALKENAGSIYDLWYEILTSTKLDISDEVLEKLATLIKNMGQNQLNSIAERGHSYASSESNLKLTPLKHISDITSGLTQVQFVMELNANLEKGGKEFLSKEIIPVLQEIRKFILQGDFKYRLVGDRTTIDDNEKLLAKFDEKITSGPGAATTDGLSSLLDSFNYNHPSENILVNLPFQVGYSSLGKLGASFSSKEGAALQILSQLYTFKNLHSKIRESNGAYGGGLTYDGLGGTLNFYSYRDPNPIKSIQTFKDTFSYGLNANWNDKDLQEAKLRIFQSVDAPINVASQGATAFFENIDDYLRQERRENFLNTTVKDLEAVTEKYLVGNKNNLSTVIGDNEILKGGDAWKIKNMQV